MKVLQLIRSPYVDVIGIFLPAAPLVFMPSRLICILYSSFGIFVRKFEDMAQNVDTRRLIYAEEVSKATKPKPIKPLENGEVVTTQTTQTPKKMQCKYIPKEKTQTTLLDAC